MALGYTLVHFFRGVEQPHPAGNNRACYSAVLGHPVALPEGFQVRFRFLEGVYILEVDGMIYAYAFPHMALVQLIIDGVQWETLYTQLQMARRTR